VLIFTPAWSHAAENWSSAYWRPGPQPGGETGQLPSPKFLKAWLVVRYNNKLQSFCPSSKYQLVAALGLMLSAEGLHRSLATWRWLDEFHVGSNAPDWTIMQHVKSYNNSDWRPYGFDRQIWHNAGVKWNFWPRRNSWPIIVYQLFCFSE